MTTAVVRCTFDSHNIVPWLSAYLDSLATSRSCNARTRHMRCLLLGNNVSSNAWQVNAPPHVAWNYRPNLFRRLCSSILQCLQLSGAAIIQGICIRTSSGLRRCCIVLSHRTQCLTIGHYGAGICFTCSYDDREEGPVSDYHWRKLRGTKPVDVRTSRIRRPPKSYFLLI